METEKPLPPQGPQESTSSHRGISPHQQPGLVGIVIVVCALVLGVGAVVYMAENNITFGSGTSAASQHRTTQAHFACSNEDEYEGLLIMAAATEPSTKAAFQDELVKATLADKCTTFSAGEEIDVIATHVREPDPLLGGQRLSLTKVSFKGRSGKEWWTSPTVIR